MYINYRDVKNAETHHYIDFGCATTKCEANSTITLGGENEESFTLWKNMLMTQTCRNLKNSLYTEDNDLLEITGRMVGYYRIL